MTIGQSFCTISFEFSERRQLHIDQAAVPDCFHSRAARFSPREGEHSKGSVYEFVETQPICAHLSTFPESGFSSDTLQSGAFRAVKTNWRPPQCRKRRPPVWRTAAIFAAACCQTHGKSALPIPEPQIADESIPPELGRSVFQMRFHKNLGVQPSS